MTPKDKAHETRIQIEKETRTTRYSWVKKRLSLMVSDLPRSSVIKLFDDSVEPLSGKEFETDLESYMNHGIIPSHRISVEIYLELYTNFGESLLDVLQNINC